VLRIVDIMLIISVIAVRLHAYSYLNVNFYGRFTQAVSVLLNFWLNYLTESSPPPRLNKDVRPCSIEYAYNPC